MPPGERHFADVLREEGYRLALFGKDHCFRAEDEALFEVRYAFSHQGPDETETEEEAAVVRWIRSARRPPGQILGEPRVNPHPPASCPTAILARRTVRFLEEYGDDRPFCAWVSCPDPHGPLQCPEPYASLHPPERVTLPPWRDDDLDGKMERRRVSIYYGMIRFVDDAIGQIFAALDRRGLAEETIVVFCSDHGDYAGEHRRLDCILAPPDVPLAPPAPPCHCLPPYRVGGNYRRPTDDTQVCCNIGGAALSRAGGRKSLTSP